MARNCSAPTLLEIDGSYPLHVGCYQDGDLTALSDRGGLIGLSSNIPYVSGTVQTYLPCEIVNIPYVHVPSYLHSEDAPHFSRAWCIIALHQLSLDAMRKLVVPTVDDQDIDVQCKGDDVHPEVE